MAYHFHWSKEEIYEMPHPERRHWVERISRINEAINNEER